MNKKIYRRVYDNPIDENGAEKPNEFLGEFEVIQQISEDFYSESFTGLNIENKKIYLVEGVEVSFKNGGTRYSALELKGLKHEH